MIGMFYINIFSEKITLKTDGDRISLSELINFSQIFLVNISISYQSEFKDRLLLQMLCFTKVF